MVVLKVTCILTSYNRPKRVREAILSVFSQTYPHWELIIVDDHSNQETQKVIQDIVKKEPRVKLIQTSIRDEERGQTTRYATCINLAIPYITGDLVTYLTDDDIYYPLRFEKMVERFEQDPDIYIVYGKQRVVYVIEDFVLAEFIRPLIGVTRSPMSQVDHNSFMHRRLCLDIVKNWDDDPSLWGHADSAFFEKLVKRWDFHPLDVITDEHRIHSKGVQIKLERGEKPWEQQDTE